MIESFPLESTGGKVWDAGIRLIGILQPYLCSLAAGSSILELGSGCGWLGMKVAQWNPAIRVTMSEQGSMGALRWLDHNISLNPSISIDSIELDWANIPETVIKQSWDMIFGCELVYSYYGAELLADVFDNLLIHGRNCVFYAHSLNRYESVDEHMLEQFALKGLKWQLIHGQSDFDNRAESYTDLFQDLKLVVFRITK